MNRIGQFFAAALIGLSANARAASLPVDGTFGAGAGCEIVAVHGTAAVVAAGGTEEFPESDAKGGEAIIVTTTLALGSDWVCAPSTVDGEYVALLCESWGATWVPLPVAHFALSGDTLRFTMPDEEPMMLERCPP
jgi:hypothetical protein